MPFGELWTSTLPQIVKAMTIIEGRALVDVSYYKEITRFVEYLKKDGGMKVQVVGHSLGGGLAMITGNKYMSRTNVKGKL